MQLRPQKCTLLTSPYAPCSQNPDKEIDQSDLFTINPGTVKNAARVKTSEQGLLEKDSSIEGLAGDVGLSHVLKFDVTVTGDGVQNLQLVGTTVSI